jgi:hypothetical protein
MFWVWKKENLFWISCICERFRAKLGHFHLLRKQWLSFLHRESYLALVSHSRSPINEGGTVEKVISPNHLHIHQPKQSRMHLRYHDHGYRWHEVCGRQLHLPLQKWKIKLRFKYFKNCRPAVRFETRARTTQASFTFQTDRIPWF